MSARKANSVAELSVHPAAAVWPMLSEPDLRRLADDIATNGQMYPIVLDADGRVLDGRNRLAACRIAGVEPVFETHTGDPVARVLSANNERRHLSLPERAAATALTLATDGHRENGRWQRGSVPNAPDSTGSRNNWQSLMSQAGLVLDYLPNALPRVAAGEIALDDAYKKAVWFKEQQKRRSELPDDLGALVDAGELSLDLALRRAKLPERYAKLVANGDLDLSEAEHLANRDEREHREAIDRSANRLRNFLDGYDCAAHMANNPNRDEVLAALSDYDRDLFLTIEKDVTWPSTLS